MRIALLFIAAFGIFMLGLKVTSGSDVSKKIPYDGPSQSAEEKWNKAKKWSKDRQK